MKQKMLLRNPNVLIILILLMSMSCMAYPRKYSSCIESRQDSTLYAIMVNDSITNIIVRARNITCESLVVSSKDSVQVDSVKTLSGVIKNVLKYLILDPSNFESNDIVFGQFSPSVSYRFVGSGKRVVYVEMDFGLKKWRILDNKKRELQMGDMKKNNIQFLRLTRIIFPKDDYLRILNDNLNILSK